VDGYAAEVKKVVKTPVVAVGAFSDPALMESVLADGTVDMIAIARGLIADPDLPNKARQGKDEDINQCLRCYTCFSGLLETKQFCCAINPVRHTGGIPGAEEIYYDLEKAGNKVVLIGGGLVGCELGIHLALNGRNVTILEMMDELNFGSNELHGQAVCEQIRIHQIKLLTNTSALGITSEGVLAKTNEAYYAARNVTNISKRASYPMLLWTRCSL